MPVPDMYSNAWIAAASCSWKRRNSSVAACGEATAQSATSVGGGRGTSLSTAAVMMPSVPSAPTSSWRSA